MILTFEKEINGRWYVVLPESEYDHEDLEMVCGADLMCDIMSQGEDLIQYDISKERPRRYVAKLTKIKETPLTGGANYCVEWNNHVSNFDIWLCDVTKHLFHEMPETLYIS